MAANKKPRRENFISKIVKDPTNPPKTILLRGYLGDSSEEGHTRLYLDPQLNNYVEVPDEAILHEEDVPKEQSPLGETYVWIDQDAQVIHGAAGPQRQKSKFLEGPIAAAAAGPGLGPAGPIFTFICTPPPSLGCPITPIHGCPPPPTPLHGCQVSQLVACPTLIGPGCGQVASVGCPVTPACPTHLCPVSQLIPCHTLIGPGCGQVASLGCPPPTPLCPPTPLHPCVTQVCTIAPQCHTPVCPPTPLAPCHTPLHGCPTPPAFCPVTPLCPSALDACPTKLCPTLLGCPTSSPQFCPVATPVGHCGGGPGDPGTPHINPGGGIIRGGG